MLDTLLSTEWLPFTTSFALLFALLSLELIFAALGFSMLGGGEADVDMGVGGPDLADLDLDLDLPEAATADFELPTDLDPDTAVSAPGGPLAWIGFGKVPFMIWLASLFLGFGTAGYLLQAASGAILGAPLPAVLAAVPAFVGGAWFAGVFGKGFAAVLPKTESSSLSARRFAGHQGVVSQGTAAAGRPAEVRFTDRHGNIHHLRAEPLEPDVHLPQGTEVLVLRNRKTGQFRITALTR